MPLIVVTALKGGVGKTTTATHLAHGLALAGFQTLLIDSDPSANASRLFGVNRKREQSGVLDLFQSGIRQVSEKRAVTIKGLKADSIEFDCRPNLDILPSNGRWAHEAQPELIFFTRNLNLLSSIYGYVIVDCAPHLEGTNQAALKAADLILVPVDGGAMSVEGLADLFLFCSRHCPSTQIAVLRTLVTKSANRTSSLSREALSTLHHECAEELERSGYKKTPRLGLLETVIHRSEIINQLSYAQKTAFDLRGKTAVADEFVELVDEMLHYAKSVQPTTRRAASSKS